MESKTACAKTHVYHTGLTNSVFENKDTYLFITTSRGGRLLYKIQRKKRSEAEAIDLNGATRRYGRM